MTTKPASSTRPSAFVRAAALILGGFGLLFALIAIDEGLDLLVFGGFLLGLGGALWWGRRVGYFIGLVGTALLVALLGLVATQQLDASSAVALGLAAIPLLLLLPPAARRPVRAHDPQQEGLPQPEGWTRELGGGWLKLVLLAATGVVMFTVGIALAVSESWSTGATIACFGAALFSCLPAFSARPRRRAGVRTTTVERDGKRVTGVLFPYSPTRTFGLLLGAGFLGLTSVGFVMNAREFADGGSEVWVIRIIGGVGILLFLGGAVAMASRGRWRRWRVVVTPEEVLFEGTARAAVRWDAVEEVEAYEMTTYVRGGVVHEPFVRVRAREPTAITGDLYDQAVRTLVPILAESVTIPIRALAVEPKALLYTLRYYHAHPEARRELGSIAAVRRIRRGDLDPAGG